jgi:hypothetical protein
VRERLGRNGRQRSSLLVPFVVGEDIEKEDARRQVQRGAASKKELK